MFNAKNEEQKSMNQTTVVKFGGSISKNDAACRKFLKEISLLSKRETFVLVHGGGPQINLWLDRLGIKSKFVNGLRYTDKQTLEVVEMVLSGKMNKGLVSELNSRGCRAVGISAKDGKTALCRRLKNLGFVGEPVRIDISLIKTLLNNGYLPIISSIGFDSSGQTLNINADSLAMSVAVALKAKRLVLLTDVPGVLDENNKTIPKIKIPEVQKLLDNNVISGGMIPKIKACVQSIRGGVKEVFIADGRGGLKKLKGTVITSESKRDRE